MQSVPGTRHQAPNRAPGLAASPKNLPISLCLLVGSAGLACQPQAPRFTEPLTFGARVVQPEVLEQGRDLYRIHCVSCHGEQGRGDGPAAAGLANPPRDLQRAQFSGVSEGELPSHEALVDLIRSGAPQRGMPTWKGMREDDLSALADFIKTFSPRWQEPNHGS